MDQSLLQAVVAGDRQALSRAITLVEHGRPLQEPADSPRPPVIGITGPPGAGKSTLIAALLDRVRARGETVAVLAIDPSSPLTGGAMLGDRIRMQGHVEDEGVYIRSMATRGHLGGLAAAASGTVRLMAMAGFDLVVVETVGVGQSEVEVMGLADTVVLVVGPAWGDEIQAHKAGIVEIADLYVVNKGDRPGAEEVSRALSQVADPKGAEVVMTIATSGDGVDQLLKALDRLSGQRPSSSA